MKVSQLLEALAAMPLDAEVFTEGCDCTGDVAEVVWEPATDLLEPDGTVLLMRSHPERAGDREA